MSRLVVTGSGVVCAAGAGLPAMTTALAAATPVLPDITALYPDAMPYPAAHAFAGFDVRAELGRKGTSFLDRASSLAMVACGYAIRDSALVVDDESRNRIGIVLGTTVGSFRSSSDYSRETMVAERPYLVNPVLFPNTVMNCAAGQVAIRYGLKGVNSTVAGGRLGFLSALQYGVNVLRRGYADTVIVGAVEELTPHTAWAHRVLGSRGLPGEAAALFVIEREEAALAAGRPEVAELVAVSSGFQPGGEPQAVAGRLADCVGQLVPGDGQLGWLALTEPDSRADDQVESATLAAIVGRGTVERIVVRDVLGDCGAAGGALQFAALLSRCRADLRQCGVMAAWMPEGAFGATAVRGGASVGARSQ